jgi:hypothetical protein
MVEILSAHTQRPLPTLVPDAFNRWAGQRERITFYAAATLIEFGSTEERDQAFAAWESDSPRTFIPVADRFLLVENPQKIPTDKIRTSGSRDYRHPPERCVTIEPDGVTLALDPSRSDLLIDAEIARIADELPVDRTAPRGSSAAPQTRRYMVSPGSVARAGEIGITPTQVNEWFFRRAGEAASTAIRLLLRALSPTPTVLNAKTMLVLTTPSEDMIDGLLQHPATKDLVGRRLGPTTVAVPSDRIQTLQDVLAKLELKFQIDLS